MLNLVELHPLCRALLTGAVVLTLPQLLVAQNISGPLEVPRITGEIVLDGRADEPEWSRAASLPLVTHSPSFGNSPADGGEVLIAHDGTHLFAAARFAVGETGGVRATSLYRDRLGADDVFRLLLDTFNDNENAVVFATTPAGIRVDLSVSGDGVEENQDFNTFWDVAADRDARGWYAEVRIPLSSLRFQPEDGGVVMGLIVSRYSAYNNETSTFPAISPDNANPLSRPSAARKVVLRGVRAERLRYVTPYALTGFDREAGLNAAQSAYDHDTSGHVEAGFDIKYSFSSNLTLDLTANTDFAQAEVDDEVVNLTRFNLFFPEKRQFFQERAGLFAVPTGSLNDPSLFFHSRRIGLTETGDELRIFGGARLVGRVGEWDVGLLDMHTDAPEDGVTENIGALRVRRRVLNDQSTVGAIATSRVDTEGRTNLAYLLDSRLKVGGNDYLTLQWGQSADTEIDEGALSSGTARFQLERPGTLTSRGAGYRVGARWSGSHFVPALGFQPRSDFTHLFANGRYGVYLDPTSPLRSIQPSLVGAVFLRNEDTSIESAFYALFVNFETRSGILGWIGVNNNVEDLIQPLVLAEDAFVPPGRHLFRTVEAAANPAPGSALRSGVEIEAGEFYDGSTIAIEVSPTWSLSPNLEVGAEYELRRVWFADRDQSFDADVARIRIDAAADIHLSVSALAQYNRASDQVSGNFRIRYHFAEGRDLFLVYNGLINTDTDRADVTLPRSQSQQLLVKFTSTLAL